MKRSAGLSCAEVARSLQQTGELMSEFAAKQAAGSADIDKMQKALDIHSDVSVTDLVESLQSKLDELDTTSGGSPASGLRKQLVAQYVEQLESTLADDKAFSAVFDHMKSNKRVRKQEAAAIAALFLSDKKRSDSRSRSLERIKSRNDRLVDSEAKRRSMSGKSAA